MEVNIDAEACSDCLDDGLLQDVSNYLYQNLKKTVTVEVPPFLVMWLLMCYGEDFKNILKIEMVE